MFSRFRKDLNIGKPADASSVATIFGKMAKIIAKTDLVGLAADANSVASLFGRLKKVSDKTDLVGTVADAKTVDTIFGRFAKVQEKVDLQNLASLAIPANAADVTVTGAAGANTKGDFVEVVAADAITSQYDVIGVNVSAISGAGKYYLELYSGAAASEVLIGAVKFTAVGNYKIQTPLLAANTRISAKISSVDGGSQTADISLSYRK